VQRTGAPPGSHLFAEFVYVAATANEVVPLRQERSAYGDEGGLDWRPYLPEVDREVGMIASEIAGRERFRYELVRLEGDLIERISAAVEANKVVVVIVDPWTIRLQPYQQLMSRLDQRTFANCVIVVPVNFSDQETAQNEGLLRHALEATFVNRHLVQDPDGFVPWIDNPAAFEANLATALAKAKLRVLRRHEVVRRAGEHALFVRPPVLVATPHATPAG
jgi:FxsC-like protein